MSGHRSHIPAWVWRPATFGMVSACAVMLAVVIFLGKGWAETWLSSISNQNSAVLERVAKIENNTKDLPLIKDHLDILWKRAGMP